MKKLYVLLLFIGIGVPCFAQQPPAEFFKGLFNNLKNADTAAIINTMLTQAQFGVLVEAKYGIKPVTQNSLDNASSFNAPLFRAAMGKVFAKFLKTLDSLHVDRDSMQYLDYSYLQEKDTSVLCTSLKGDVYFKSGEKYYQWNIAEAILIKGKWTLLDPGKITDLKDHSFLTSPPNRVTVFNSLTVSSRVKLVHVVLQPPPPLNMQTPQEPPKPKKSGN